MQAFLGVLHHQGVASFGAFTKTATASLNFFAKVFRFF